MVTATNGKAGQFMTENIMTGTTDVCWLLTKSGKVIKTSGTMAYVYVKDNRQTVCYPERKKCCSSSAAKHSPCIRSALRLPYNIRTYKPFVIYRYNRAGPYGAYSKRSAAVRHIGGMLPQCLVPAMPAISRALQRGTHNARYHKMGFHYP